MSYIGMDGKVRKDNLTNWGERPLGFDCVALGKCRAKVKCRDGSVRVLLRVPHIRKSQPVDVGQLPEHHIPIQRDPWYRL